MNGLIEKVCLHDATVYANTLCSDVYSQMGSPDQDFRYMGLNDLLLEIKNDPNSFLGDEPMETKVLTQVLTLVQDKISEVKNQAVKWYVFFYVPLQALSDV